MILNMIVIMALMIYGFVLGYNWKTMWNWKKPKKIPAKTMSFDLSNPININAIENQIRK